MIAIAQRLIPRPSRLDVSQEQRRLISAHRPGNREAIRIDDGAATGPGNTSLSPARGAAVELRRYRYAWCEPVVLHRQLDALQFAGCMVALQPPKDAHEKFELRRSAEKPVAARRDCKMQTRNTKVPLVAACGRI